MDYSHKLEEGLWASCPKQQHVNRYRITLLLSRLGLDIDLEGIRLVHWGFPDGGVGLIGDKRWRSTILPVFFWGM